MSLNFLVRNRSAEETVRMAAVRAQFAEVAGSIRVYFLYFQEGSNPLDRIERRRSGAFGGLIGPVGRLGLGWSLGLGMCLTQHFNLQSGSTLLP